MMRKKYQKALSFWLALIMVFSVFTSYIPVVAAEGTVSDVEENVSEIAENTLRIHYQRTDNDYANLGVWTWDDVASPTENWPTGGIPFSEELTDYGAYLDLELKSDAAKVGFLVLNVTNGDKDGDDKRVELFSPEINEIWIKQGSDQVFLWEPVDLPENTVRIHYERDAGDYENWAAWVWGDVATESGAVASWPDGATDLSGVGKHGAYYDIELKEDAKSMGFLFVNKKGDGQTSDIKFEMLADYQHIFVKDGDTTGYTNPYGSIPVALISAELLSDTKIELKFSKTEGLSEEELLKVITVKDVAGDEVQVAAATIKNGTTVELTGNFDLEMGPYSVTYQEKVVTASAGWKMIDELYAYDGKLGATLHEDGTATLKVWSPKADDVAVVLYDKVDQNKVVSEIPMELGDRGVWSVTLDVANTELDSLRGYFYHYAITHGEETKLALDPYAKSMAAWSHEFAGKDYPYGKAAIVDLSTIGPELDFATIPGFEKREDAIIYEVHVRDFTSDETIGEELTAQFGTFAAFVEKLDYIQDLGVTHVQLLPVMSYFFGDELKNAERMLEYASTQTNYNWGYDPHSYFSLSGMYSENPSDPELRVAEFKKLIAEIHNRDMGVLLDVVYNHTARVGIFEDLVPNYYHFMDADGTPRTSFGGGRLGTTHEMARRILVDSILHWVDEYKVDGFRFDMMGDHDAESIQIAFDKAKELNPNILMIGEGWRTFAGDEGEPVQAADQDWMQYTEAVGSFSDEFRNELKSGFGSEGQPRFITGGARSVQQIFENIKAQPRNFVADQPGDVVPYIEAHDNLTLYDVIAQSIKKDPELPENDLEIHKRIRIGNAMVLTAQGTAFIHAGQEFGRTKQWRADATTAPYKSTFMEDTNGNPFTHPYFIHDSYDSSDIINRFDWTKATNAEKFPINNVTREYTEGLIELRKSTDAFRLGDKDLVDANITLVKAAEIKTNDLVVAYRNVATNGDVYFVFINADTKERTLTLQKDLTKGIVLVDSDEAGTDEVSEQSGFELTNVNVTLEPLTTVVVKIDPADEVEGPGAEEPGAPEPVNVYEKVVLRGNAPGLAWDGDSNPLTFVSEEGVWKSNPIQLPGGKEVEFKFVMDNEWMDGENLRYTPAQSAKYQFVFDPDNERKVSVLLADEFTGSLTLQLEVPEGTPDWVIPTVASNLNSYNFSVTSMIKVGAGTYQLNLSGTAGAKLSYFYGLGDEKFREVRTEARVAEFVEGGKVYEDTVTEWSGIPVAKNVNHNFKHEPLIPSKADDVTITVTVEHYGPITDGSVYYTTDGTTPVGARGIADNGEVAALKVVSSEEVNTLTTTVLKGDIPAQANQTPVKYKLDVWDEAGEGSQFADTNSVVSDEATEFAYYVDAFTSPNWAKEAVIYQIFVDRFKDGNKDNNYDVKPDLPLEEALKDWMGGDIAGIIQELDYLENLGVNTLWLSPVFEGPYSHGYHPADFLEVDKNFGELEELKELIAKAHAKGMKVIYDFVPNHTSNEHPFFQDALENGVDSEYYNYYTFYEDGSYETFYGIESLPQFNNDYPAARDYMLNEVVPFWLEEVGFDGFRLDYAKGPSNSFWVDFRHTVKQLGDDKYIFGEIWDNRTKINSYAGKLDGALDFGFHDTFKGTFKGGSMKNISKMIEQNKAVYHPEYIMTSFLDNHDVPRFFYEVGENEALLKLASFAQFTLPGSPVIYYGTEVGMSQSENHDDYTDWKDRWYREMMPWNEEEQNLEILAHYKKIIALRNENKVLVNGSYTELLANQNVLAFDRKNNDQQVLVVVNKGAETTIDVGEVYNQASLTDIELTNLLNEDEVFVAENGTIAITVPANGFAIYAFTNGNIEREDELIDADRKYNQVVLRGQAPLSWEGENDPLTYDPEEKVWKSNPIELVEGEIEFKYILDGAWMEGDNLRFTAAVAGKYVFVFKALDERIVDVRLVEDGSPEDPVVPDPVDPDPTDPTDPTPPEDNVVNNPQAGKGKIAVPVAKGKKQVLLPPQAAAIDKFKNFGCQSGICRENFPPNK
ncbi:pullulanase [Bacillaceae bacterium IKA-2]|nr:pullulanase [Bacillaceae bacterium IKA-2]